jgi:hypothetical protein
VETSKDNNNKEMQALTKNKKRVKTVGDGVG